MKNREGIRTSFALKAGGLASSMLVGQLISAVNLALLARLFSVEPIGHLQVFLSYAGILATINLLAYEVLLPHLEEPQYRAMVQALFAILIVGTLLIFSAFLVTGYEYPLAMALFIASLGLRRLSENVNLRRQTVSVLAGSQILSPLTLTLWALGIALGWYGDGTSRTLIYGYVGSNIVTAAIYTFVSLKGTRLEWRNWRASCAICREKRRNPLLIAPADLLNAMTYNLPVILLERFFDLQWAAYYGVVLRFCLGPASTIGGSIGKMFHSDVAKSARTGEGDNLARYYKLRKYLALLGVVAGVVILALFPPAISIVLGSEWVEAGRIGQVLAPLCATMLAVSPLTNMFYVFEQQWLLFNFQVVYIIISILSFGIGILVGNVWVAIGLFSALSAMRYLGILVYANRLSRLHLAPSEMIGARR